MTGVLLLIGVVIIICILSNRFTEKLPIPSLLVFLALGICFGENGVFRIQFNDYQIAETICSICLIFIMYYGGFGTNIKAAKSVLAKSVLMSTVGVVLTAGFVGAFVHFCFGIGWLESLLVSSVIASTDAASVFHILRSQRLNLKDNTASLLEIESGSNDPISYMLTVVLVTMLSGKEISIPLMLAQQVVLGIGCGILLGKLSVWALNKFHFNIAQGRTIFVFAVAVLGYALPAFIGGNGYLSVYLCGIILGNAKIPDKREQVHFFDVLTGVCQMMIFFLLGLLVTPTELPAVILPALLIMLFMTLVGRPLATTMILLPFRSSFRQIGVVSWAGLRGVASIVFAIYAVLNGVPLKYNLFNLVFCVVLFSISLQGSLLPWVSKKLKMIDNKADVRRTFNDYQEESDINFVKIHIGTGHPWVGKNLKEIPLPAEFLVTIILRKQDQVVVPNGDTVIQEGDLLVIAGEGFEDRENLTMQEVTVEKGHKWNNLPLSQVPIPKGTLIVMVQRPGETIIPSGDTVIRTGDVLVVARF